MFDRKCWNSSYGMVFTTWVFLNVPMLCILRSDVASVYLIKLVRVVIYTDVALGGAHSIEYSVMF